MNAIETAIVISIVAVIVAGNYALTQRGPWGQLRARYCTGTIPVGKKLRFQSAFLQRGTASAFYQCSLACSLSDQGIGLTNNFWLPSFLRRDVFIPWSDIRVGIVTPTSIELVIEDVMLTLNGKRLVTAVSALSHKIQSTKANPSQATGSQLA